MSNDAYDPDPTISGGCLARPSCASCGRPLPYGAGVVLGRFRALCFECGRRPRDYWIDERERGRIAAVREAAQPIDGMSTADIFGLAAAHLECAVMLRILHYRKNGGPTAFDRDAVRASAQLIAEHADDTLFGGPFCAEVIERVVEALAVLSFQPGGVHCSGLHFESV